jgi:hypothetical protein
MAQQELRTLAQERYLYADLLAISCEEILYWRITKVAYFNFLLNPRASQDRSVSTVHNLNFTEPKSKPGSLSLYSSQSEYQQF